MVGFTNRLLQRAALVWCVVAHAAIAMPDAGCVSPAAGPEPVASYRISAALDPIQHRVMAKESVRFRNASSAELYELYFHLYLNAFAHPRTAFMRDAMRSRRGFAFLGAPGGISITRLVAREFGSSDLLVRLAPHSPDDPDDATDLRLTLPQPLAPGQILTLDLEFTAALPELIERAGFADSFHAVTQWFPKLARLEPDGTQNHFVYTALAEFSSDFGTYDVTIDVPAGFTIAAPGEWTVEDAAPNRRREHYCVDGVHDFAWFAWDQFVMTRERVGPVEVRHFAGAGQGKNTRATLDAVRFGLEHFGRRYFPYPYRSLTVVHPPDRARGAGGMEYPQLISIGGPWYLPYTGLRATEALVLHELAHQWFYGVVANDEHRHPVLDEGLTSWAEVDSLGSRFGAGSMFDTNWLRISEAPLRRVDARRYARRGPLALPAARFADFAALSDAIYARFPTLLETLGRVYGEADLRRALGIYARQFMFGHPDPAAFVAALRPNLPRGATEALSAALFSDGWVDFALCRIDSRWEPEQRLYRNRIQLERRGTLDFPVELEVEFADGHIVRRPLESVATNTVVEWPHRSPMAAATLDPDRRITIDDDPSNQTRRVAPAAANTFRLAAALHWLGSVLTGVGWP